MGEHYPHPAERSADRFFEDRFPVTIMLCRLARVRRNLVSQHWLRRLLDLYRVATVAKVLRRRLGTFIVPELV